MGWEKNDESKENVSVSNIYPIELKLFPMLGEIAAVVVNNDSEATLKRLYFYHERSMLILKAENPTYEDMIFQNEELNEVHVLGKAVAFQSDVW